jgi:predicted site-specific integrase-resolvase
MKGNPQTTGNLSDTNSSEVWLDKQDILQRMYISNSTLQRWRRKKILPYSRVGRKIWYREADLLKLLEKARVGDLKID